MARLCNHCCSGKAISVTYSECVFVAQGIQHRMRMRHIVICGSSSCTVSFKIYLINYVNFHKEGSLSLDGVLPYTSLSEIFLIPSRIQPDTVINVH
jgi:hypothetical protein